MGGIKGYAVKVTSTERIVAAAPLPEHWMSPSNFDLLLPPMDVNIFFCYKPNPNKQPFSEKVALLKKSLAELLITYYPFAGEVVTAPSGEPELHCNNRGVDFTVAHADVELAQLQLHDMDESVGNKLVATKQGGVLCVQVTELRCGGVVLAATFAHNIADGYSTNRFLVAWGETARSKPISFTPTYRRSILHPRRPGHYDASVDRLFFPISSLPPPVPSDEPAVNRMYYIPASVMSRLQSSSKCSKLEALAAYLWRVVLVAAARRQGASTVSLGIPVDGRFRFGKGSAAAASASSMEGYFGNVLSVPFDTLKVEELERMSAAEVAGKVHACIQAAGTEEHFRGVVDWVEERRPAPAGARVYFPGAEGVGEVAAVVSSGRGFPVAEVEFPWGRPVFGSPLFLWPAGTGHVMPMSSPCVEGDWIVYVHMLKGHVDALEEEAGDVFRPVTPEYLSLSGGAGTGTE